MVRHGSKQHRRWSDRISRAAVMLLLVTANVVVTAPAHQARSEPLKFAPSKFAPTQLAPVQLAQSQYAKLHQMPPVSELVVQYRELALRAEFGGQARRGRIIKWTGPIVAELRGANLDVYEPEVIRHLQLLAQLTGLSFRTVRAGQPGPLPNMVITFIHNGGHGPRDLENVCSARVFSGNDYVIQRAAIRIHADWNLLRRHCIVEELTQALGLMNDSTYFSPSIFNDHSKQQALSPWDRLMVRAHYDRRLLPGMSWAFAEPIVRDHFRRRIAALYRPAVKRKAVRRKKRRR